jgi:predicted transcriptional regulator
VERGRACRAEEKLDKSPEVGVQQAYFRYSEEADVQDREIAKASLLLMGIKM